MDMALRLQGPWKSEDLDVIPEGHTIVAEFPSVVWGWECDLYRWILRAPDGRRYIGGISHGNFYEVSPASLYEDIDMHYSVAYFLEKVYACITQ